MNLRPFRGRRLMPLLCCSLAAAWFGVACGNDGSAGDGATTDDGSARAGTLGVAGLSGNNGGSASAMGGRNGTGGTSVSGGALGMGGMPETSGGQSSSGGSSGRGGSGGTPGTGGSATTGGTGNAGSGGRATGGTGTGGSGVGGSSGGSTTTGGSIANGGTGAVGGKSTGIGGMVVSLTCGNGIVETGEQCDDSPLTGGSGGGSGGSGETTTAPFGQLCSNGCFKVGTQACLDCEMEDTCVDYVDACLGPPEAPFNAQQRTQCYAVMRCIQATNCFDGSAAIGSGCYCGTLTDTAVCSAAPYTGPGSPDGPCKAEFQAGMTGVTSNSVVLGTLTNNGDRPTSAAARRLNCQKTAKISPTTRTCASECGFSSTAQFPPLP